MISEEEKNSIRKKIYEGMKLSHFVGDRVKRFKLAPIKSAIFYVLQAAAYVRPYKVTKTTPFNVKMSYFLPEGGMVFYYGFFESDMTFLFLRLLKEGDVFVDVGAHIGYYSLLAARLVGESGKVYSFEPTPRTFSTLKENCAQFSVISTYNCALSDKEGESTFFDYGPKYSAFNSLSKRVESNISFKHNPEEVKVRVFTYDSVMKDVEGSPALIKIDAEGAEARILSSMSQTISRHRPVITIEVGAGDEWKGNCQEALTVLKNHGYDIYEISEAGFLIPHIVQESYLYANLVGIHPEKKNKYPSLFIKE